MISIKQSIKNNNIIHELATTINTPIEDTPETGRYTGTFLARHIEKPIKKFHFAILKAPSKNLIQKPYRWEKNIILAETEKGANRIAKYHFYKSNKFIIISEITPTTN